MRKTDGISQERQSLNTVVCVFDEQKQLADVFVDTGNSRFTAVFQALPRKCGVAKSSNAMRLYLLLKQ